MSIEHATRRGALGLVAVLALLGLAACGSDNDSTDAGSGQTATTAASSVTTAAPTFTSTTAAAAVLKTAKSEKFGTILVDANGKSLYTFDRDTSPTSACTGTCAGTWPPLLIPAGGGTPVPNTGVTGKLALSARSEGGSQITLNDKPLYRYSGDVNAGDTAGDGVGGIWHIAIQA